MLAGQVLLHLSPGRVDIHLLPCPHVVIPLYHWAAGSVVSLEAGHSLPGGSATLCGCGFRAQALLWGPPRNVPAGVRRDPAPPSWGWPQDARRPPASDPRPALCAEARGLMVPGPSSIPTSSGCPGHGEAILTCEATQFCWCRISETPPGWPAQWAPPLNAGCS